MSQFFITTVLQNFPHTVFECGVLSASDVSQVASGVLCLSWCVGVLDEFV